MVIVRFRCRRGSCCRLVVFLIALLVHYWSSVDSSVVHCHPVVRASGGGRLSLHPAFLHRWNTSRSLRRLFVVDQQQENGQEAAATGAKRRKSSSVPLRVASHDDTEQQQRQASFTDDDPKQQQLQEQRQQTEDTLLSIQRNGKYIRGLLDNLRYQCDRWIVTGSTTCQERANNILQQIRESSSLMHAAVSDEKYVETAQNMMAQVGMTTTSFSSSNNEDNQPKMNNTGKTNLGSTNHASKERQRQAQERTQWEHDFRSESQQRSSPAEGRSALSRRNANKQHKDIMLGEIDSNLESFVNQKQDLQHTMESSGVERSGSVEEMVTTTSLLQQESVQNAATKSAELVAMAGMEYGNFEGEHMGIGGLDEVLSEIKRRIWVPLAAPPTLLDELGIAPVRGLLLYGRPGCGKTLLAKTVGRVLSPSRPITVVSGPELMDKYVGSSEKNLREVFDNPPDIYEKKNEALAAAALHVIILDEFDAMARSRGGKDGGGDQGDAGVARDSVVNQLLAKMDGVEALVVPTLVIGLTNKRSLIDSALLRPGRFEVQIEVPPPKTAAQRISILKVHTRQMLNAGRLLVSDSPAGTAAAQHANNNDMSSLLTYEELLGLLAAECDGMTGAELAGVARAAASHALTRAVLDFSADPSHHSMMQECLVTQQDFEDAVHDVYERHSNDWDEEEDDEEPTVATDASSIDDNEETIE